VDQGREDAAFLSLWNGRMTVHNGIRSGRAPRANRPRLFAVRGECKEEAHAFEVDCEADSLRSCGVYALVDADGSIRLWVGASAPQHAQETATAWATLLLVDRPIELGLSATGDDDCNLKMESEGSETVPFRKAVSLDDDIEQQNLCFYLAKFAAPPVSPRLFHMTSVSGKFLVTEIECAFRRTDMLCAMPFNQSDLYGAEQPALFLLDAGSVLWLWQGWFPETAGEDNNMNGAAMVRWHAERRAAMQTTADWRRVRHGWASLSCADSGGKMLLAWAGCEPKEFINLFPAWRHRHDVEACNRKVNYGLFTL